MPSADETYPASALADDVRDADTLRAAFARLRPQRKDRAALRRFGTFVRAAVAAVLGTDAADEPRAFATWNPLQRALLQLIAETPYELHLNAGDLGRKLETLGAIGMGGTDDDRYLARYAGLRESSALEREVGGRPLWLLLRLHLMGRLPIEAWIAATARLDAAQRVDLARRALDNAYQLMRRWPLPHDVSKTVEREDAPKLQLALVPVLAALTTGDLEQALDHEIGERIVVDSFIVVLAVLLLERDQELRAELDAAIGDALSLQTNVELGRRLLARLPPARRAALVEHVGLVPYNLDGWLYLDLLEPGDRARIVARALAGSKHACQQPVAAILRALVLQLDDASCEPLRVLAATEGPNAELIAAALAERP
jgi:hypothetical protein